jgi:hypothetical protein
VFIRFITTWIDPDSREAAGLFMAAQHLESWESFPPAASVTTSTG